MGCIGCHTATPDGSFVGFTGNYPWPNALASVESGSMGAMPDFLGAAGGETLSTYWHGIITFSAGHWGAGDHVGITTLSTQAVDPNAALIWMELDSGATGVLARQGDPAGAAAPSFSHDGTRVVYTSTTPTKTAAWASAPPISTRSPSAIARAARRRRSPAPPMRATRSTTRRSRRTIR